MNSQTKRRGVIAVGVLIFLVLPGLLLITGSGRVLLYQSTFQFGPKSAQAWAMKKISTEDPALAIPPLLVLLEYTELPGVVSKEDPDLFYRLNKSFNGLAEDTMLLKALYLLCQNSPQSTDLEFKLLGISVIENPDILKAILASISKAKPELRQHLAFILSLAHLSSSPKQDPDLAERVFEELKRIAAEDPEPKIRSRTLLFLCRQEAKSSSKLSDDQRRSIRNQLIEHRTEQIDGYLAEHKTNSEIRDLLNLDPLARFHISLNKEDQLEVLRQILDKPPASAFLAEDLASNSAAHERSPALNKAVYAGLRSVEDTRALKFVSLQLQQNPKSPLADVIPLAEELFESKTTKERIQGARLLCAHYQRRRSLNFPPYSPRAQTLLRRGLTDENTAIRRELVLAFMGPDSNPLEASLLPGLLKDEDLQVRFFAAVRSKATAELETVVPIFFQTFTEERALGHHSTPDIGEFFEVAESDDNPMANMARWFLQMSGHEAIPILLRYLDQQKPENLDRLLEDLHSLEEIGPETLETASGQSGLIAERARSALDRLARKPE